LPTRRGGNYGNGYTVRKAREQAERATKATAQKNHDHEMRKIDPASPAAEARDDISQVDVEQLAEAPLRNPSDALEILARTSPSTDLDYDEEEETNGTGEKPVAGKRLPHDVGPGVPMTAAQETHDRQALKNINNFPLVRVGLINAIQLRRYVSIFIARHNHYLPIIPEKRLPNDDQRLSQFAMEETFLLMVMVVIASRYDKDSIHESCWKFTRCHLSGITYGGLPTVSVVEALLLLSENLPKLPQVADNELHRVEGFMAWNLIGLAVRFSYFLGLDQKTLLPPSEVYDERTSRERLAWTYCYIFDRQVSIRLGKAFWSRGPGPCFQNPPEIEMNIYLESHNNFPSLTYGESGPHLNHDIDHPALSTPRTALSYSNNSSLVQAYFELTQILTNVHDTLYPSRDQTIALVRVGEYYRMLDEFTRTFNGFCITWEDKHHWKNFPLNETVWATLHYTKLYAYSFAFQAHVQRATMRQRERLGNVKSEESLSQLIFPRGLTGCPDAKFILEATNSASRLLKICVRDLFTGGALAFLPSRFYGYFSYAAVFLIKVVLTGAVVDSERKKILTLLGQTITAFQSASPGVDKQHLGVRSARQLKSLVRALTLATGTSLAPTPNSFGSPMSADDSQQQLAQGDLPLSDDDYAMWFNELEVSPMVDYHTASDGAPSNVAFHSETPLLSEASAQELAALLSTDIDSDMWLSFF
jgi:hypothetical protein